MTKIPRSGPMPLLQECFALANNRQDNPTPKSVPRENYSETIKALPMALYTHDNNKMSDASVDARGGMCRVHETVNPLDRCWG